MIGMKWSRTQREVSFPFYCDGLEGGWGEEEEKSSDEDEDTIQVRKLNWTQSP